MNDCIHARSILKGISEDPNGYFCVNIGRGLKQRKRQQAHRFVYEECFGPIPEGLLVRHSCDNPPCVNPEHLVLGTNADNSNDMRIRGRSTKGSKSGTAKLNEQQVAEIRATPKEVESARSMALRFGVTEGTINNVRSGRRW